MALSKQAKIGVGVGVVGVLLLGTTIALAASGKRRKSGAPSLEEMESGKLTIPSPSAVTGTKDDEDDDDDVETSPGVVPGIYVPGGGTTIDVPGVGPVTVPNGVNLGQPEITIPVGTGGAPVPVPVVLPPVVAPTPTAPVPVPITVPLPVPVPVPTAPTIAPVDEDAAAMVADLLAAERSSGWKREYDSVTAWQLSADRPVDGKFGPGDAIVLAQTVGTIPVIRYWPAKDGVNPQRAISDYRNALLTIAATKTPQHAAELKASAAREKGQSFGPPTGTGGKGPAV